MEGEANKHVYSGMTVNDRLYAAGLLARFDQAVRCRDRELMIRLGGVELASQAERIADTVLQHPEKYGF